MRIAKPDAVLFDLDGTLADTAPDLGEAANRLRQRHNLAPLPLPTLRPYTSHGVRGMLQAAFDLGPDDPRYTTLAEQFLELYAERLCHRTTLFDGMEDLLSILERASIKWGIVTNKRMRYTDPLIAALSLHERACCVISGDSAARPKPAPDPLLLACERASLVPARCIYIGDDLRDIEAGRAAGMTTVAAAYGYIGIGAPIEHWQADATIHSPAELLRLIDITAW
ncbi:MAG: HAD-IA family hydrolase [Rhodocyclales bacterium]|nr:HAD-IA family hydrolase [Rhodocyclales bacterium]